MCCALCTDLTQRECKVICWCTWCSRGMSQACKKCPSSAFLSENCCKPQCFHIEMPCWRKKWRVLQVSGTAMLHCSHLLRMWHRTHKRTDGDSRGCFLVSDKRCARVCAEPNHRVASCASHHSFSAECEWHACGLSHFHCVVLHAPSTGGIIRLNGPSRMNYNGTGGCFVPPEPIPPFHSSAGT